MGHALRHERCLPRATDRRTREVHREADLAVEKQRCRKNRSPWKVVGKEWCRERNLKQRARRFVRAALEFDELGRGDAMETTGGRARRAQQAEALAQRLGRIEFRYRQHRSEAVSELDGLRAVDARRASIRDGVIVESFDLHAKLELRTGRDVAVEDRLVG